MDVSASSACCLYIYGYGATDSWTGAMADWRVDWYVNCPIPF